MPEAGIEALGALAEKCSVQGKQLHLRHVVVQTDKISINSLSIFICIFCDAKLAP